MTSIDGNADELARDHTLSEPAGLFRRAVALAVDAIIVLVIVQAAVALLFSVTNGEIQGRFWLGLSLCGPVDPGPLPLPDVGVRLIEDCSETVFGMPTGRGMKIEQNGAVTELGLTPQGTLLDSVTQVQSVYLPVLLVYLIGLEALWGATIGKALVGVRVIATSRPTTIGVPTKNAIIRNLVLVPSLLWFVGSTLWPTIAAKPDGGYRIFLHFNLQLSGLIALTCAGVLVFSIICNSPIHDRLAGTKVVTDRFE